MCCLQCPQLADFCLSRPAENDPLQPFMLSCLKSNFQQSIHDCSGINRLHRPGEKDRSHAIPLNRHSPAVTFNLNATV